MTGITLPITISMFLLLNGILHNPHLLQSLQSDIISSYIIERDPTYILPTIAAGTTLATAELNSNMSVSATVQKYLKFAIRTLTLVSIYITSYFPIGLFVYWIPNSVLSLLWLLIQRQPSYRRYFNLPTQDEIVKLQTDDKLASQFLQSAERNIQLVDYSTPPIYAQKYPKQDIIFFHDRKSKEIQKHNSRRR
uniref:Mitochondrial inner membrane protein OXA1L n=1 Tax=Lygus hesperus TaxID=30085 RepID=A0A0A9YKZ9_LYGHE